jgi:hypothetical protein
MKSSGFWHHRKRSDAFDVSQCTAEQTGEGAEDEPAFRSERDKEEGAILCNSNTIRVIEIFCKHCGLLCRRLIFEQPACPLLFKCQQVALPASKNHTHSSAYDIINPSKKTIAHQGLGMPMDLFFQDEIGICGFNNPEKHI